MSVVLVRSELHTAAVDPLTGCGLVLCPDPERDVDIDDESTSLAAADFASLVDRLTVEGWEPGECDGSGPSDPYCFGVAVDGTRTDGRVLLALVHPDPITSDLDFPELATSYAECREALTPPVGTVAEHR